MSDHDGVQDLWLLDQHGQAATPAVADWVAQHLGQSLVSLLYRGAEPLQSTDSVSVSPPSRQRRLDEVADDLDAIVRSLRVPPASRRTLIRMHAFVHDDGFASGGLQTLDCPDHPAEGCDDPDELARVHLAATMLRRFTTT